MRIGQPLQALIEYATSSTNQPNHTSHIALLNYSKVYQPKLQCIAQSTVMFYYSQHSAQRTIMTRYKPRLSIIPHTLISHESDRALP